MIQGKNRSGNRLERTLQKTLKNKEKNVRFASETPISSKSIRINWIPELSKKPRMPSQIDNYKNVYFSWCVTHADREGTWSWNEPRDWTEKEFNNEIEGHFNKLISNSWREIENLTYNGSEKYRKKLNKYQPIDSLCSEAQERWFNNPELVQFDEIFRFRLGSNKRIWGIRVYHHFFTIWYERKHKICPPNDKD